MFGLTPPVIPGTTSSDTAGAFAVLSVLGNDSAYKQRLDELVANVTAATNAADRSVAEAKRAAAAQAAAEAALAAMGPRESAMNDRLQQVNALIASNKADAEKQEAALQARTAQVEADQRAYADAANKEITQRKEGLDQRQLDLADAERVNEQRETSRQQWMEKATADVTARQQALSEAEDKNKVETVALKSLRADLEKRMGQLRQLVT